MYIYLHLPFCTSICSYCDFPKLLYDKKYMNNYLKCLEEEIKSRYQGEEVVSIFIGGGTPTCLEIEELEKLLNITNIFKKKKEIEFTIESNVESLTLEKIKLLHRYHINRVSLGVQSFQPDVLKELNRHHTKEEVVKVIEQLKKEGINNISIDYIYGVNTNIEALKKDISTFLKLDIPHISCYSLIIEENTILKLKDKKYIDENIEYQMYQEIENILEKNQYKHYEISNYAKEGYQSKHNLNYWNNGEYYGFGLGAVSYINSTRRTNTKNLSNYLKGIYLFKEEKEDLKTKISNEFIIGLRKIEGISISNLKEKYGTDILKIYDIEELLKNNLLEIVDDHLRIPKQYIYTSNNILLHFI